jgi:hypothetical protein
MKKYFIIFAALGLLIGYFAKVQYWFEDEKDVLFPITKAQLRIKKNSTAGVNANQNTASPNQVANVNPANSAATPVDLQNLSQYELFNELYNSKVLNQTNNHALYFDKIRARLKSAYPAHEVSEFKTKYEKEVANRIGLLKAMSVFWPTPRQVSLSQKPIKLFFYEVASNKSENVMVRRQAYKNWMSFGNSISETEKNKFLNDNDTKLLHLVSLSDDALAESLTESVD